MRSTRDDYARANKFRTDAEAISEYLYPNDAGEHGRILRLKQEYLFVSAGLTSILRTFKFDDGPDAWDRFPDLVAIHTNDTHPAMCGAELMRLFMDEEGLDWDTAWDLVTRSVSYTNHTVLPEALEKWPIDTFRRLLPRVYMIIDEIDRRYMESFPRDIEGWQEKMRNTAILWDGQVRMANLSVICSHSVNGARPAAHRNPRARDAARLLRAHAEKFNNKTNGISPRRFLGNANPSLSALITERIGNGWYRDAAELKKLEAFADDEAFLDGLAASKRANKERLAAYIERTCGVTVDVDSIFDVQVKRFHAYKRQLLNIFKVMYLYAHRMLDDPSFKPHKTTFIFSGKAASAYTFAKEVIRLINSVADVINSDDRVNDTIKVVFIPNFAVSNAQLIYPRDRDLRADLHSRQRGLRHLEHEAHDERRDHAGDARRGQHRDPQSSPGARTRRSSAWRSRRSRPCAPATTTHGTWSTPTATASDASSPTSPTAPAAVCRQTSSPSTPSS